MPNSASLARNSSGSHRRCRWAKGLGLPSLSRMPKAEGGHQRASMNQPIAECKGPAARIQGLASRGAAICNSQGREPLEREQDVAARQPAEGRYIPAGKPRIAAPRLGEGAGIPPTSGLTPRLLHCRRSAATSANADLNRQTAGPHPPPLSQKARGEDCPHPLPLSQKARGDSRPYSGPWCVRSPRGARSPQHVADLIEPDRGDQIEVVLQRSILAAIDPVAAHAEHPPAGTLAGEHQLRADLVLGLLQLGLRDALGMGRAGRRPSPLVNLLGVFRAQLTWVTNTPAP